MNYETPKIYVTKEKYLYYVKVSCTMNYVWQKFIEHYPFMNVSADERIYQVFIAIF